MNETDFQNLIGKTKNLNMYKICLFKKNYWNIASRQIDIQKKLFLETGKNSDIISFEKKFWISALSRPNM